MVALEDIIKRCKKYDVTAQRLLYERYANRMHSICMRYISNHHEIKDIVHDGFIKIFSDIKQYSGKGSFEGWMVRILINTTLMHIRKNKQRRYALSIENIENTLIDIDSPVDLEDDSDNDYSLIEQTNFTQTEIIEIILSIPEPYRVVFNLFHMEGFRHEEIARMLKIETSSSRIRLLRARNLIRKKLIIRAKEIQNTKYVQP